MVLSDTKKQTARVMVVANQKGEKKGQIDDLKDKKICVYCASGYRGNIAADELVKAGFSAVNLEGGYMTWTR